MFPFGCSTITTERKAKEAKKDMNNIIIAMSVMKEDFQETLKLKDEELEKLKLSAFDVEGKNKKLEGDHSEGIKENERMQ